MTTRIALVCFLLAVVSANAISSNTSASDGSDTFGKVRFVVFDAETDVPVPNLSILVKTVRVGTTNEDGVADVELFGGLYHFTLDIGDGVDREVALRVLPEKSVEAIVSIHPDNDEVALSLEFSSEAKDAAASADDVAVSSIKGTVVHDETGEGIQAARIFVRGLPVEAQTDAQGRFEIQVPIGVHDIVVVHSEYGTVTQSGVAVTEGAPAEVTITTAPVGVELQELTVTAPRIEGSTVDILKERKETTQVSDVIGAEQMAKSGDSNAAAALKRVTGVTIVGGKYVYVRGLGERYSSTRLNGLGLPSPDPERRVVPLDMFPAAILDSMVIQKTYSPDAPGEFGGGVVDLRTKGYPDELTLKIGLSTGVNVGSTFRNTAFSSDGGPTDFLGIDGGHRELPGIVKDATDDAALETGDRFKKGYSESDLSKFSRAMPKNWGIEKRRLPPDFKVSLTGGNGFKIKQSKLGFLASVIYKNDWDYLEKDVNTCKIVNQENNELGYSNRYRFFETTNTITLGGVLALGADLGEDHHLRANTIVNRITDDGLWRYQGRSFDADLDIKVYNYEWTERMIFSEQVLGTHALGEHLELDWRYAYSSADRKEPDKRFIRYDYMPDEDSWKASGHPNSNRRDYLLVDDKAHDLGLDLKWKFKQWSDEDAFVKGGGAVFLKDREVDVRRFKYEPIDNVDIEARKASPEAFFVDENMGADGMLLVEATNATDNYKGEHDIFAGYLLSELPLGRGFKVTGGVRLEQSDQVVRTRSLFDSDESEEKRINELDILPAVVFVYEFEPDMVVRLGYGKTVNRPDFSEMTPGCSSSFVGGYDNCGAWESEDFDNKLKRAQIHNVDVRWEWYPSQGESISFGGFFKAFIDPIENVVKAGTDKVKFVMNALSARNFGLELDFRKDLSFIHEKASDLYLAGNATWVFSRVRIPDITEVVQTNKNRPLQGQSPYILNGQLGYDNADIGTSAVLLYNVFGKRISDVGVLGLPDVYEQPFHQLDFVVKQKIKSHFSLGFSAKNLIDGKVSFKQGDKIRKSYKKGRYFGLSASFTY